MSPLMACQLEKPGVSLMATIRTFIGIPIPSTPALRNAQQRMDRFGRAVKDTSPDNLHITLKFLGDTQRAQVDEIANVVRMATTSIPAHEIDLIGLGAFPNANRPSVVWVGIRPADHLKQLAAELDRLLEPLGFLPEARAFHAHLTLAYVKGQAPGLGEMVLEGRDIDFGKAIVSGVDLYQSELTPTGSHYTSLAKAALGKA